MKTIVRKLILLFALIIITIASIQFVILVNANPYLYEQDKGEVTPLSGITPPKITIYYPKNNSIIVGNNISLTFNLHLIVPTLPELFYYYLSLDEVYYETSWLSNKTNLDIQPVIHSIPHERFQTEEISPIWKTDWFIKGYDFSYNFSVNLENVPKGIQWLKVSASLVGLRQTSFDTSRYATIHYGRYTLIGSSKVNFSVGNIFVLSPKNMIYNSSIVLLLFEVPDSTKEFTYSLDGQKNVVVNGNSTLTILSQGIHNITVYATDFADNVGSSETLTFTVTNSDAFPTLFIVVSIIIVAIVSVSLLIYFRRHKHQKYFS